MRKALLHVRWISRKVRNSWFFVQGFWEPTVRALNLLIPCLLFIAFGITVYDLGFHSLRSNGSGINFWLTVLLDLVALLMTVRLVLELFVRKKRWTRILSLLFTVVMLVCAMVLLPAKAGQGDTEANRYLFYKLVLYAGILLVFIIELSHLLQLIYTGGFNPGTLMAGSFVLMIAIGTFLLKMPGATYHGIGTIDALFTATSAACITGLTVVDTATHFTPFGQLILLLLIQAGGLGVMTFAGVFAYAVAGQTSIRTQLAFKDMVSSGNMSDVLRFLVRVVLVTLLFEMIGVFCVYLSLGDGMFANWLDRLFFSVFHAISAFCNAGFSTRSLGLYDPALRYNYPLQLSMALLIILGGFGFPVVFNLYRYLRVKLINLVRRLTGDPRRLHFPGLSFINGKLAMMVSAVLLAIGFVCYLLFEQGATLRDHPTIAGKIVTSFFGSVTPRTAGFNTVNVSDLSLPTVMIYLLLMYIGTSPGSTGGGIKTTTAGVAMLNLVAILRGRDRAHFLRSEISHQSVRRAFAIIILSLLCLGLSVFLITMNDGAKGLIAIAFEVFSAFSTTGLSLGITPDLSVYSKLVVVATMFVGRIGMITLLVAFIRQSPQIYYRYPKEDIAF